MKHIKEIIEGYGLIVTYTNKSNMWMKAKDTIIMCSLHDMFGLAEDDLMLYIKQKFYRLNVKVDLENPENNKRIPTKSKIDHPKYIPVGERKQNIRKLLTDKFKLLP